MKIENFALIVGTMKGGTTSLFNYLAQHPQVAPCTYKEPDFFAYESRFAKGFDYYQSLWEWQPNLHQVAIEASVSYTRSTLIDVMNAAENIAKCQDLANFKFIYILRDPLKRIESHYTHGIAYKSKQRPDASLAAIDREILDTSRYSMQIGEYYRRFAKENILLLNFDELKRNPTGLMQKVCNFLAIEPSFEFQRLNSVHNDSSNKKLRINWYGLNIPMKARLHHLVKKIPADYKQPLHRLLGSKTTDYFQLSEAQRAYILQELKDDLRQLDCTYGFDISQWNLDLEHTSLGNS